MLLTDRAQIEEAIGLYKDILGMDLTAATHFAVYNERLMAEGSIRCYYGSWHLRCCVVKPKFRVLLLQRQLIRERIEYLADKTDKVTVNVLVTNTHSIANLEAEGFEHVRTRKFAGGDLAYTYRKIFSKDL